MQIRGMRHLLARLHVDHFVWMSDEIKCDCLATHVFLFLIFDTDDISGASGRAILIPERWSLTQMPGYKPIYTRLLDRYLNGWSWLGRHVMDIKWICATLFKCSSSCIWVGGVRRRNSQLDRLYDKAAVLCNLLSSAVCTASMQKMCYVCGQTYML